LIIIIISFAYTQCHACSSLIVAVIHIEAIIVPLKKFVKESVFVLYNNRKKLGSESYWQFSILG
jgi:hypothetical protein